MRTRLFPAAVAVAISIALLGSQQPNAAFAQGQSPYPNYPFAQPKPSHPLFQAINSPTIQPANGAGGNNEGATVKPRRHVNADIAVKPDSGEWLVHIITYKGENAHAMARKMVSLLRAEPYRLWAYVYDHTAEAIQRQQLEREKLKQKYRQLMKVTGSTQGTIKIRVPKFNIEEQVAVLVGGYKSRETARKALNEIRKLPMPDPKKVELNRMFAVDYDKKKAGEVPVNPFAKAFIGRNPTLPNEGPLDSEMDIRMLRHLNASEPYSLLKCKKNFTLAVKEFRLPSYVEESNEKSSPIIRTIFGKTSAERKDVAAHNAQNLAGWLRDQCKLEAYVLHTRYSSVVTVGGFDSLNDPQILTTQQRIGRVHQQFAQMAQNNPQFDVLRIFRFGVPMKVPQ